MTAHIPVHLPDFKAATQAAGLAIPPAWPLAATVAVNPYLGQTGETLATAAARLARIGGIPATQPRHWYAARIADGRISDADLAAALAASPHPLAHDLAGLKAAAGTDRPAPAALPTVADLAATCMGRDWPALIEDRFGHWAAAHFDQGQALWASPAAKGAYAAWQAMATHDLTPEIAGLTGFAAHAANAPDMAEAAISRACLTLGLPVDAAETYFHALLTTLGGWAQAARQQQFSAGIRGATDATLRDLLAIRLLWEEALYNLAGPRIAPEWLAACEAHARPVVPSDDDIIDAVLQEAAERATQRGIVASLTAPRPRDDRPVLQAAFCIDVRSEVFRRALESAAPGIQTIGFAGFFGLGVAQQGFASDVVEDRLPVLLNAGLTSADKGTGTPADTAARLSARATRAWARFKTAAVSSFAFVEATGPVYAARLVRDALSLGAQPGPGPAPQITTELDTEAQIAAAHTVLTAMGMTETFAPTVLILGHGSHVTNNPHQSALQCGACGGHAGDVNARLLAALLNSGPVRAGVKARGIAIPPDTVFIGGLHDTTSDSVTLFDDGRTAPAEVSVWLAAAGRTARAERAGKLPGATPEVRGRNWAEVRPEWGLAGCQAFIAAPRGMTSGASLDGRSFLHDYHWQADPGFKVLELILTAPVVVASWISLQYYGSAVAPDAFGGGNKLIHNVSGGFGVVEGTGGNLRTGLPWQSVHDGQKLMHDPLRLTVLVAAPQDAITDILSRHSGVRQLFDNRWLHLLALDDQGQVSGRYTSDLTWQRTH